MAMTERCEACGQARTPSGDGPDGGAVVPSDMLGQVGAGGLDLGALGHPKKSAFLAAYARVGNVTEAAALAGVHRNAHYWWLNADDGYREAFVEAHAAYCDRIEQEIRTRAIEGEDEPIVNQRTGEVVGTRKKKSDLLLIFAAKGAMPHKYRDNAPLPAQPGPDIARRLSRLSGEQLEELLDLVRRGELPNDPRSLDMFLARAEAGERPALPEPDGG